MDGEFNVAGDKVNQYLLLASSCDGSLATQARLTSVRVVCNNTLTLSLNTKSKNMVKVSHRREFDGDLVKETLGVAKHKLEQYKEMAEHLSKKRFTNESIVEYFARVFPVLTQKADPRKELSKSATYALEEALMEQPGAELGEGTWWQAFNTVTYMTDHIIGRSVDSRLTSAWYGANKNLKTKALELAVEMADAA